jgi:hypothetical protein
MKAIILQEALVSLGIRAELPVLNTGATLRGEPIDAAWYFGTYMTKNLYGLTSPLDV